MTPVSSQHATLLASAARQLGLSQDRIPEYYFKELQDHVGILPNDLNFLAHLQPAKGYGIVTCLEPACKKANVMLGPNTGIPGGGFKRGFGSLQNYTTHAVEHQRSGNEHVTSSQHPLSSRTGRSMAFTLERSAASHAKNLHASLRTQLDTGFGDLASVPSTTFQDVNPFLGITGVAAKPADKLLTTSSKRQLSLVSVGVTNDGLEEGALTPPSSKRVKLEPIKSPLAFVDANAGLMATDAVQTARPLLAFNQHHNYATMTLEEQPMYFQEPHMQTLAQEALENAFFNNSFLLRKDFPYPQGAASGSQMALGQTIYQWLPPDDMDTEEELNFLLSGWAEPPVDVDRNTHGSGEDQYIAPSKNPDDINKFLIAAGNSEQFDGNASVTKALEKLKLPSLYSMLPGMAVSLLPHQTIGVAWALDREKGSDKGGCLGDEMGLGKTVQTIALMVINASNNSMCKTNLIVAPMALLDQWKLEIETKTNNLKCLIYHGPSKPKQKTELMKYDVVLTTYHTLALEWPDLEAEEVARRKIRKRKRSDLFVVSDPEDDRRAKRKKRELGLLFQIRWYRIIIDEAQNIRNRRTRISRSVTDLEATYRWCLTGTPIVNGLVDAYPLFRFIRLRPWYDWDDFNSHISRIEKKNPSLASTRLQAIFKMILLRRKKDSLLDGKRLIELPLKTVTLKKLAFSQEEREIYQMVEARSQAKFNRFLRTGTVLKNYHQVLVMLLRLRQICVHPVLIQETCDALVASNELNGGRDLKAERARATRLVSAEFVSKLTRQYKEAAMARILAERESADAIADADECPVCMDSPTDAIVTACGHTFCRECIVNVLNGPCVVDEENPQKYKGNERACPSCRSAISGDRIFIREAFEPQDHDLVEAGPSHCKADTYSGVETLHMSENILRDSKGKGKAKKRLHRRRSICNSDCEGYDDNLSDFIVEDDEDEDSRRELKPLKRKRMIVESDDDIEEDERETIFGHKESYVPTNEVKMLSRFLPSTKMKKMMEHLREWAEEHPDEKTIVISQWTEALKLVSNYLVENSIGHVKYQGSMNREQRDKAVRVFMLSDKAPVMLMSLKCGGVGLNLTRANRVISLDLGWSEAIENQAFDRVHRLGQQRNVFVQRLVIENTVEDRILALQERKRNLADGSLGEGNGKKIGRLNVRELANLFGLDHRGNLL